jgi:hypothetical protein
MLKELQSQGFFLFWQHDLEPVMNIRPSNTKRKLYGARLTVALDASDPYSRLLLSFLSNFSYTITICPGARDREPTL